MSALSLSVVIPAYNEEQIIGDCLARLTAQLEYITEIIVVDNNSTDKTVDIVRSLADRFPEVALVAETEQGLVYARNTGLDAAAGVLIARIDADTLVPPHWARRIVEFFAQDTTESWAAACGRGEAYGLPYGGLLGNVKQRLRDRKRGQVKEIPVLYGSNMVLRRETWAAIRADVAMRRDIFEDVDTGLCVTAIGGRNAFLPTITVGVAARRMEASLPAFIRYMVCLPRTLRLHKRYALMVGAVLVYLPTIIALHAVRLVLLRAYDSETRTFAVTNMLRRTTDRVAP